MIVFTQPLALLLSWSKTSIFYSYFVHILGRLRRHAVRPVWRKGVHTYFVHILGRLRRHAVRPVWRQGVHTYFVHILGRLRRHVAKPVWSIHAYVNL